MTIPYSKIPEITGGRILNMAEDHPVEHLLTDSRKLIIAPESVFFAIKGERHDGRRFIPELFRKGIRQFVAETASGVPEEVVMSSNFIVVNSSLEALQQIAAYKRSLFQIPVIGITGSNGKTIIKEWLYEALSSQLKIVKSPKSYNSQLGAPLSVWQMNQTHELGLFEAGISRPGEMEKLQKVIQPTIGIFTNIGAAHDEGFASARQKIMEKIKLFSSCHSIIYNRDYAGIHEAITAVYNKPGVQLFSWSLNGDADIRVASIEKESDFSRLTLEYEGKILHFDAPFTDSASLENCMHCIAYMLFENFSHPFIQKSLNRLQNVAMRLELKQGVNNSYVIDDSYNNDLAGLQVALDFLNQQRQREKKTAILSDILQSGMPPRELYEKVALLLKEKRVGRLIGIGEEISANRHLFDMECEFYPSTEAFLQEFKSSRFENELILVKGARVFEFERIVRRIQQKVHGTTLEINLDALVNNLNFYKSRIRPETKIMVMVKAFAYGSGLSEIAHLLQYHRVDYLAVAYADEGATLRENGVTLPIMVMNPSPDSFPKIVEHNLEPEIYSLRILSALTSYLRMQKKTARIHIKLDTGMHRLGFTRDDIAKLAQELRNLPEITVAGVFTHLVGADEPAFDEYTVEQAGKFIACCDELEKLTGVKPLRHILNSAGIIRFPQYQFDMVRLGIGLYGIDASEQEQKSLTPISELKTRISQIKTLPAGETVGYSRKGRLEKESRIATIGIGYADGFSRAFGNGKGVVLVNGKRAPVIGNVCMDMCMIDITGIDAEEGDEVLIFGKELPVGELAQRIDTIPYEILTSVSERVKRIYFTE